MKIDLGIAPESREEIAQGLARVLADSYTLYAKTHNFHWNVTGPLFGTLHTLFEEHYRELADAIDEVAERIRALGHHAPGSFREFLSLTSIEEATGTLAAPDMVRELVEGNEAIARTARGAFTVAADAHDEATVDLLTQRIRLHEKNAWMLRSIIDG